MPGSFVPGLIKAGTYFTPRGKEFWYVSRTKQHTITMELENEPYARLVLGFEDPHAPPGYGIRLGPPPDHLMLG